MDQDKIKQIFTQFKDLAIYIVFVIALYFLMNTFLGDNDEELFIEADDDIVVENLEATQVIEIIESIQETMIDREFVNSFLGENKEDFSRRVIPTSKGKTSLFE